MARGILATGCASGTRLVISFDNLSIPCEHSFPEELGLN